MSYWSERMPAAVRAALLRVLVCSAPVVCASPARAAGVEDTVASTLGLGRAAHYGRVNDFFATAQNPANLALVPRAELAGELRLPLLHACFDRSVDANLEYKQPGAYAGFAGNESFGRVCNAAWPLPAGNLGWAQSFPERWGYGLGLFTPSAAGRAKYGEDTIVAWHPEQDERYQPTLTGVASPNRQLLLERTAIVAFAMAGVGAAPSEKLRLGISVGWGFFGISNRTVVSVVGGTFRDQEIMTELKAVDWAVPRLVGSVVVSPLDSLELFAVAVYQGDVSARGRAELTANGIEGAPLRSCSDPQPGTHCALSSVRLRAPFPTMEVVVGARYALARRRRERVLDPLRDEYFDVEVDLAWTETSHVDAFRIALHDRDPGDPETPRIQFANFPRAAAFPIRREMVIPKAWRDTWSVRAGADVNLVPGRLALRAGFSFSSRAVPIRYMNLDYWPVRKLGIHAGATLALGRVQLSIAYAHLFYQRVTVATGTGLIKDQSFQSELDATGVNEGEFTARQDILSGQLNLAF